MHPGGNEFRGRAVTTFRPLRSMYKSEPSLEGGKSWGETAELLTSAPLSKSLRVSALTGFQKCTDLPESCPQLWQSAKSSFVLETKVLASQRQVVTVQLVSVIVREHHSFLEDHHNFLLDRHIRLWGHRIHLPLECRLEEEVAVVYRSQAVRVQLWALGRRDSVEYSSSQV
jgi:hypothetical protein